MLKKICYWVVGINYIVGIGFSIYFISRWIGNTGGFICIALQCVFFMCLSKAYDFNKEDIIENYKWNNER